MTNSVIYIVNDWQLTSLNEYADFVSVKENELQNISSSIIVVSYDFYKNSNMLNTVTSKNTIIVTSDNDSIILSNNLPNDVLQIVDGVPLSNNKYLFNVHSEFMSTSDTLNHASTLRYNSRYGTFFTLIGRHDTHREMLVNELLNTNVIDNGYVVYHDSGKLSANIVCHLQQTHINDAFSKNFIKPEDNNYWHDGYASKYFYENYNLELVTETTTKAHFVTEKTIKPLSANMPFLTLSSPGYLKYLRSIGFKTFGDYFDESYDAINDTHKRVKAIVTVLNDLINTGEIYKLTDKCYDVLIHNSTHANKLAMTHQTRKRQRITDIINEVINSYS